MKANMKLFNIIRLDHFRGFHSYWSIPANASSAKEGKWEKGPGIFLFEAIQKTYPDIKLIAEDLGIIPEEVQALKKSIGTPGMSVLQFAFDNNLKNAFLPHNLEKNNVLYSGTHDNDTTLGWYLSRYEDEKLQIQTYLGVSGNDISWDFIKVVYNSVCNLAIITAQDLLSKGFEARFNTPGTPNNNWTWRMTQDELDHLRTIAPSIQKLKSTFGR